MYPIRQFTYQVCERKNLIRKVKIDIFIRAFDVACIYTHVNEHHKATTTTTATTIIVPLVFFSSKTSSYHTNINKNFL